MLARLARGRLYYGWIIVLTLSLTQLTSWGVLYYGFGVIMPVMQRELGWSRVVLTGGFSLALLISGIAAAPVGHWLDRNGARALMTVGSVAAVLLLLAWSQVTTVLGFYLVWAGLGLAFAAVLYEPAFAAVATWFQHGRGRALAVLTFFGGLASLVFIPLTERLITDFGWRTALIQLAIVVGVVTILPHALVLRHRPGDLGLQPDGDATVHTLATLPVERSLTSGQAMRAAPFWWLAAAFSLTTLVMITLNVHLVAYLLEQGYPSTFAASAAGLHGLMSVSGRLTLAPLGRRFTLTHLSVALFLMQTIAIVVLLLAPSQIGVLGYVVLFGLGSGASTPVRAALVAEHYGTAAYGRINGALTMLGTWARVAAPVGAGALSVVIGYRPLLWGLAVAAAIAAGCVWRAVPNHRQD
jgi:MFS family permease